MAKDYLKKLQALQGAVVGEYNVHNHIIQSPSPSFNFTFGNTHGLPLGFTLALGGPPKGGKSLMCNSITGEIHRTDPDAYVLKYDTERRERGQLSPAQAKAWGIDRDRYVAYSTNDPVLIFDGIAKDVKALIQDGMKLKLVIIDSLSNIKGRQAIAADTVDQQLVGDEARTVKAGLKQILDVQRDHNFAVILTTQISVEMDPNEQRRTGSKVKMNLPFYAQHFCEYFMYIERDHTKEGKTDLSGNEFKDESKGDIFDNAEQTGHKIRFKMKDSSLGPKGRSGELTFDYNKGIINIHEEVFTLAKNRGIFTMPNNRTYIFGEKQWTSKDACLTAIKEDTELQKAIITELKKQDLAGKYVDEDVE